MQVIDAFATQVPVSGCWGWRGAGQKCTCLSASSLAVHQPSAATPLGLVTLNAATGPWGPPASLAGAPQGEPGRPPEDHPGVHHQGDLRSGGGRPLQRAVSRRATSMPPLVCGSRKPGWVQQPPCLNVVSACRAACPATGAPQHLYDVPVLSSPSAWRSLPSRPAAAQLPLQHCHPVAARGGAGGAAGGAACAVQGAAEGAG